MSMLLTKVITQITIQDIGRWGFQSSGVPVSGPMDIQTFQHANLLVGNDADVACMEIGIGSVKILITQTSLIALCGSGHQLTVNEIKVANNKPILVSIGCTLKLKPTSNGTWSYLSIGGGFEIHKVLGSRSTYLTSGFGGFEGRALKAGDEISNQSNYSSITTSLIKLLSGAKTDFAQTSWSLGSLYEHRSRVRIIPGPEWNWISGTDQEKFINQSFIISNDSNRMGYRLKSIPIARQVKDEMISSGVSRGTIQLTNDGSLIVLMADSQTIGGYPRIAQVAAVDISSLAQTIPGGEIKFELISNEEAEALLLEKESDLRKLKTGLRLKIL